MGATTVAHGFARDTAELSAACAGPVEVRGRAARTIAVPARSRFLITGNRHSGSANQGEVHGRPSHPSGRAVSVFGGHASRRPIRPRRARLAARSAPDLTVPYRRPAVPLRHVEVAGRRATVPGIGGRRHEPAFRTPGPHCGGPTASPLVRSPSRLLEDQAKALFTSGEYPVSGQVRGTLRDRSTQEPARR